MTIQWRGLAMGLTVLVLLGWIGLPAPASAQVVTGEEAFPVLEVDDAFLEILGAQLGVPEEDKATFKGSFISQKIGYKCQIFGLFWAYIAWWDCQPVMFKHTGAENFEYFPLDPAQATDADHKALVEAVLAALEKKAGGKKFAEAYPSSSMQMGFWSQHGRWVLGGIIVVLVVIAVLRKRAAAQSTAFPTASHESGPKAPGA